ncbi:MAG: hypothetical protein DI555_06910 [Novosphingobium pentaromativorans]|uniref:Uncharacterized protein n=1 Tax=Novosphingobium pentaromativorans TaxID=205844 RepID=A0A2W5QWE8_9SPHN|nr:MAG: hypothetical protein DI555_06910 [Novosphingobium pentaromativorans]
MSIIARLIAAGVDADLIEDVAMLIAEKNAAEKSVEERKRKATERQQRKRERDGMSRSVTQRHVTERDERDPSLSPSSFPQTPNQHPHTHPDITPAREEVRSRNGAPAKPDEVSAQTWADFLDLRKRKRAQLTPTAMAGIVREAAKAGWTLEDALAETVTRGWQSFKADFVEGRRSPHQPPGRHEQPSLVDTILRRAS